MKKIIVLGMLVGMFSPMVAMADETEANVKVNESSSEGTSTIESSSIQPEMTESTNTVILSDKQTEDKKVESIEKAVGDEKKAELTVVDLTKRFVIFKKGAPITEAEFYQVAKEAPVMKQDGVKSFTFVDGQTVSTAVIGEFMDSVKLLGTTSTGEVRVYAMSYIVKNEIATLTLSNIVYDEKTSTLSGQSIAGADIIITDDWAKEKNKVDVVADENGRFEMKGTFKAGSTWYIQAFDAKDPLGNYSEIITFIIPDKQVIQSESTSNDKVIDTPVSNSKTKDAKKLPQTGVESAHSIMLMGGTIIGLVVLSYIKLKLVKDL